MRGSPVSESVSKKEKQDLLDSPALHGPTTISWHHHIDSQLCSSTEEVSPFPKARFARSCVSWLLGERELRSVFTQVRPFVQAASHHPIILALSYLKSHKPLLQQFLVRWTPVDSLSSTDFYNTCRTSSTPGTSTPLSK